MKYRIYTLIFLLMCLFPAAGMLVLGPAEPAANEQLPAAPKLTDPDGTFNMEVIQDTTDFLGRRFALRQEMVTANHGMMAALFRTSTEPKVILGREDFLFYTDTLADYEGMNTMTEREAWSAARTLALIQEQAEERGMEFLFTVAPNKNSICPQYMPGRYPAWPEHRNIQLLVPMLEQEGVRYADLFEPLASQDKVLYRRHDSHWTQEGAGLACDVILETLGRSAEPWYGGATETVEEVPGDLYEMLYPRGRELDQETVYTRDFTFAYTQPIRSVEDNYIRTETPGKEGSLLMFRDSFGNALHLFMAEEFGRATFCRLNPFPLQLLDTEAPDTVVIELVERNLRWLIERPPVMPAPVRSLSGTYAPGDILLTGTAAASEQLPGYTEITGTVDAVLDTSSPVYLRSGGQVYEATPTGENTFSAFLPSETLGAEITALVTVSGRNAETEPVQTDTLFQSENEGD